MRKKYEKPDIDVINFEILNSLMTGDDGAEIGPGPQMSTNEGVDWD